MKKLRGKGSYKEYIFLVIWLVLVDQLSKYLIRTYNPQVDLGFLSLYLTTNTGAIFGYFKGMNSIFIVLSFVAIALLLYYFKELGPQHAAPLALVLTGVLGNLIDRLWLGHVVDFIDFLIWPSFNLADSCITIGVIWLLYNEWNGKGKKCN